MWYRQILFLVGCLVAYGEYIITRPKGSDVEIPESLEKLEKTFPQGSDWMRLFKPERAVAKHKALKLIFRNLPDKGDELIMEKSIFLYLPHRESAPTTNYKVYIQDLFTGRVIARKFLPIQNTGWYKVLLNRWPDDSYRGFGLTSANHGLEIRLRQKNGVGIDFEEFYKNEKSSHKFLPSLLIYYENKGPQSLKDFFNAREFESLDTLLSNMSANPRWTEQGTEKDGLPSGLPANPSRIKRHTMATSCHYTTVDMYLYFNLTAYNVISYYPNTTRLCTGSCTTSSITSTTCDRHVQDCCVASKKRTFITLSMENNGVVLRSHPDLVVEECACASSLPKNGTKNKG